jgi:hypothetical protein
MPIRFVCANDKSGFPQNQADTPPCKSGGEEYLPNKGMPANHSLGFTDKTNVDTIV